MPKAILAADLFCGAGGTSTGLARACKERGLPVRLLAINHWQVAVDSHEANHPWAEHRCQPVEAVDPTEAVPGGRLDLLVASPECTHFSVARGGKPKDDQKRASPWFVMDWISKLYVKSLLIENVAEFQTWGPLGSDGLPLKSKRGETFKAFIHAIQSHGYQVSYRVLNSADFGATTSRKRLFIIGRRGHDLVEWPRQTHSKGGKVKGTKRWRGAREKIDFSIPNPSIFGRKRPLAPATVERIFEGAERLWAPEVQPFIIAMRGTSPKQIERSASSIDDPSPAVLAGGGHLGLVEPFLLSNASGGAPRSLEEPSPTNVGGAGPALVEPFLVAAGSREFQARPLSEPAPAIIPKSGQALVEPILIQTGFTKGNGSYTRSVDEPSFVQTTRMDQGVLEARLVSAHLQTHWGERKGQKPRVHDIEAPAPAITSRGPALVEGMLVPYHGRSFAYGVDEPMKTLGTKDQFGLCQAHLQHVTHGGRSHSIDEPAPAITAANRGELALVEPVVIDGVMLDIRFRMLQPHELQGLMGFDGEYKFVGNKGEQVRQIGNAVEVNMATALCRSLLKGVAA